MNESPTKRAGDEEDHHRLQLLQDETTVSLISATLPTSVPSISRWFGEAWNSAYDSVGEIGEESRYTRVNEGAVGDERRLETNTGPEHKTLRAWAEERVSGSHQTSFILHYQYTDVHNLQPQRLIPRAADTNGVSYPLSISIPKYSITSDWARVLKASHPLTPPLLHFSPSPTPPPPGRISKPTSSQPRPAPSRIYCPPDRSSGPDAG